MIPGEQFFSKLSDEILEASNQITTRFEEGLSVLLTGKLPEGSAGGQDGASPPSSGNQFSYEDIDIDELSDEEVAELLQQQSMEYSPLEGIADNVIADIVSRQVTSTQLLWECCRIVSMK